MEAVESFDTLSARAAGEAEDDAWVLELVYDRTSDHSYVAVLDGQHLEDGPLETVHFDHPIPVTFHGGFSAAC